MLKKKRLPENKSLDEIGQILNQANENLNKTRANLTKEREKAPETEELLREAEKVNKDAIRMNHQATQTMDKDSIEQESDRTAIECINSALGQTYKRGESLHKEILFRVFQKYVLPTKDVTKKYKIVECLSRYFQFGRYYFGSSGPYREKKFWDTFCVFWISAQIKPLVMKNPIKRYKLSSEFRRKIEGATQKALDRAKIPKKSEMGNETRKQEYEPLVSGAHVKLP